MRDEFCHCGCGERTNLAKKSAGRGGTKVGEPAKYIAGHQRRRQGPEYAIEDRGYDTPCWIWQGYIDPKTGYGHKYDGGLHRMRTAHRIYYERFKGQLPPGHEPDHLCRVRPCINPDHLEAVTRTENARRGLVGQHLRKITHEQTDAIRVSEGPASVIAAQYGISKRRVYEIRRMT